MGKGRYEECVNVIQSIVIDLVVTIGKWCLILLGPFEKAYDMCLRILCSEIQKGAIIY